MLAYVTLTVALLSMLVSLYTWYRTYRKRKYDVADELLYELHKIVLEYPEFGDPEFCNSAVEHSDRKIRFRYDAYASQVWNFLEKLYETFGSSLKNSPFYGAMRHYGQLHKRWLFSENNMSFYSKELIQFLRVET